LWRPDSSDYHEEIESLLHRYLQKEVVMKQLLGLGDVSRLIGIARHKIEYAIANGTIPEPTLRIANKRAFTEGDLQRIADYFGVGIKNGDDAKEGGE